MRKLAFGFFIRGAERFVDTGPNLTEQQKKQNSEIAQDNLFLDRFRIHEPTTSQQLEQQLSVLGDWFAAHKSSFIVPTEGSGYWKIAFFDTRLARYVMRTCTLDFGVLRNDPNRTVISEVVSRLKYSLTLSILP